MTCRGRHKHQCSVMRTHSERNNVVESTDRDGVMAAEWGGEDLWDDDWKNSLWFIMLRFIISCSLRSEVSSIWFYLFFICTFFTFLQAFVSFHKGLILLPSSAQFVCFFLLFLCSSCGINSQIPSSHASVRSGSTNYKLIDPVVGFVLDSYSPTFC